MVGPLNSTITVINQSGKVVSTSKHLVSVFKEAKAAYLFKKSEIHASRSNNVDERRVRKTLERASISDDHLPGRAGSTSQIKRSKTTTSRRQKDQHEGRRRSLERGYTDTIYADKAYYGAPPSQDPLADPGRALIRRNTSPPRPKSSSSFDEHLAYGNLPPPVPSGRFENEIEVQGKMSKLTQLLDEANCLQYSATAMVEHLQKNPDALAAVALSLAEVSTMVSRLGPSALSSLRVAFPAATALLASPQFLIAAGVGVGVTVVMLGGYKIIKRIKEGKDIAREDDATQLREIEGDLSAIEAWRRGIADAEAESVGTTVEGEFITPHAANQLVEEGVISPSSISRRHTTANVSSKSRSGRSEHSQRRRSSRAESESRHHHHSSKSRRGDDDARSSRSGSTRDGKKKKSVGGLKLLFQDKLGL